MPRVSRALASVVLAVLCACSGERTGLSPGDKAPDIKGTDSSGAQVSLRQVQGRAILVNFWATWCAPCMAELPALQALYSQLKDQGFTVVGVAVDDAPDGVKRAQETFGLTYPIIIDSDSQSKRRFEVKGLPESFVLNGEQLVQVVLDPDGKSGPVTRIIGPREWGQSWAAQVLSSVGASRP